MSEPINTLDSIMQYEIDEIKKGLSYVVFYDMEVVVHTPNGDFPILYPIRLDRLKDYVDHFSDVINLTVAMTGGMVAHDIFPYQENLEITLKMLPLTTTTGYGRKENGTILNKRFTARLTKHEGHLVEGNSDAITNKAVAGNEHVVACTFQLVDKVIMSLRSKTVGTIVRDTTPMELIRFCLTEYSKDLDSGDSEKIAGVTIAPGYTEETRDHIIIPHLTRLTSLPRVVNEAVGGIYPTGFSYYLESNFWYVFPLYDTERFSKSDFTLTIINVPKNRLPGIEKTFRLTSTQLIIMSTGEVKHIDTSISERDSLGAATRFVDSRKVVEGFGSIEENRFKTNFASNVTEATISGTDGDPTQQAVHEKIIVTSAYNMEYSKLAERAGSKIMITWENSNDLLLTPGMPIRYMFLVEGKTHQLYGTLLAAETMSAPTNKDPKQKKFGSTTTLSCFVTRDVTNRSVK